MTIKLSTFLLASLLLHSCWYKLSRPYPLLRHIPICTTQWVTEKIDLLFAYQYKHYWKLF